MAALSTLNQGSEKPATEPQSSGQPTVERLSTASPAAVPPPGPPPATKPQKSEQPEWSPALENQLLRTFGTWLFGLGAALTFVAGISAYFINTAVIENANAKAERAALDRISDIRRQMDAIDSRMTDLTLKLNDNVSKISTKLSDSVGEISGHASSAKRLASFAEENAKDAKSQLDNMKKLIADRQEVIQSLTGGKSLDQIASDPKFQQAVTSQLQQKITTELDDKSPFKNYVDNQISVIKSNVSELAKKDDVRDLIRQSMVQSRPRLSDETVRDVAQIEFWGPNPVYKVAYNCPTNSVLVGMEFDMQALNGVRTPIRIKYNCRQLSP